MSKTRKTRKIADKKYVQVGRVLDVLKVLTGQGPHSTSELSAKLEVSERTTVRFMAAMQRYGWAVQYLRDGLIPTAQLKWGVETDKLAHQLNIRNGRKPSV